MENKYDSYIQHASKMYEEWTGASIDLLKFNKLIKIKKPDIRRNIKKTTDCLSDGTER
jgi:hypothetical protein